MPKPPAKTPDASDDENALIKAYAEQTKQHKAHDLTVPGPKNSELAQVPDDEALAALKPPKDPDTPPH